MMMHAFLTAHRDEIIALTRVKVVQRRAPRPTEAELENGIPLFLDQLIETLQNPSMSTETEMGKTATMHGSNLLRMGFTIGQVVP